MVLVFFLFLFAGVVVVVTGIVSATTCRISYLHPRGRSLRGRVSSDYFWIGLGLAYGLWFIFLGLALFEYEQQISMFEFGEPATRLAFFTLGISPVLLALCLRQGIRRESCTQPVWQIMAIFAVAAFAAVSLVCRIIGLLGHS